MNCKGADGFAQISYLENADGGIQERGAPCAYDGLHPVQHRGDRPPPLCVQGPHRLSLQTYPGQQRGLGEHLPVPAGAFGDDAGEQPHQEHPGSAYLCPPRTEYALPQPGDLHHHLVYGPSHCGLSEIPAVQKRGTVFLHVHPGHGGGYRGIHGGGSCSS